MRILGERKLLLGFINCLHLELMWKLTEQMLKVRKPQEERHDKSKMKHKLSSNRLRLSCWDTKLRIWAFFAGIHGQSLTVPLVKAKWGGDLQPLTRSWSPDRFGALGVPKLQMTCINTEMFRCVSEFSSHYVMRLVCIWLLLSILLLIPMIASYSVSTIMSFFIWHKGKGRI